MKRYYIIHESHFEKPVQFLWKEAPLWHAFEGKGCQWWDLGDGHRILVGDFRDEDREHVWNSHPATVHLHHPVKEKTLPLSHLLTPEHAHKRFQVTHLDLLTKALRITEGHTLEHLNAALGAVHPGCVIYPIPKKSTLWLY